MKILVIGSGAREHALVWKLAQSPRVKEIYTAPGNAGTARISQNLDINAADIETLVRTVEEKRIEPCFDSSAPFLSQQKRVYP